MDTKWAYERTEENEVKLNRNRNSSGILKKRLRVDALLENCSLLNVVLNTVSNIVEQYPGQLRKSPVEF